MMDLDNQPTFEEIKNEWNQIKSSVKMIDDARLSQLSVPDEYLQLQYSHTDVDGKFGKSITDQRTLTSTRIHAQGDSELCWLYSESTSLCRSVKLLIDSLPAGRMKKKAFKALKEKALKFWSR